MKAEGYSAAGQLQRTHRRSLPATAVGEKAARTKEQAARKGLTLPAMPLGTFFAHLTMKKNLSRKHGDFEQELI